MKTENNKQEDELTVSRWQEYQENGKAVSNQTMMEWLKSWGTEQEKP